MSRQRVVISLVEGDPLVWMLCANAAISDGGSPNPLSWSAVSRTEAGPPQGRHMSFLDRVFYHAPEKKRVAARRGACLVRMADTGAKATETALNPEAKSFVLRNANEVEPFKPPDVGSIHWGKVISVHPFGAFVRLDTFAKDGLCHVSQLTHPVGGKRIEAREVVSEGQRIVCKVIDRSWSKMRFFLSAKWVDQESGADLDPDMANHLAEVQAAKAAPREDAARAEDAGKAKPRPDKPAAGRREAGAGESAAGKSDQKAPAPDSGRAQKPGEKASGAGGGDGPQQLTISHKVCKALVKQLKSETTARPAAVVVSKIASLLRTLRQPDPTRAGRKAAGDAREAGAAKGDGAAARGAGEWERSSAKGKGTRGGAAGTGGPVTVQQEYYATALASLVETGLCKQLVRAVRREALGNTVEALAEAIRDCSGDGLLRDALGSHARPPARPPTRPPHSGPLRAHQPREQRPVGCPARARKRAGGRAGGRRALRRGPRGAGTRGRARSWRRSSGLGARKRKGRASPSCRRAAPCPGARLPCSAAARWAAAAAARRLPAQPLSGAARRGAQAVRSLAINNHANRERLRAAGAVGPLTAILGQRSLAGGRGLAAAAQALRDMCCENDANRAAFLEAGALAPPSCAPAPRRARWRCVRLRSAAAPRAAAAAPKPKPGPMRKPRGSRDAPPARARPPQAPRPRSWPR